MQVECASLQLSALGFRLMNTFRFLELRVYQDARVFFRDITQIAKSFPTDYSYMKSQLCRAGLSIVLNIAEGSGKGSDKEFNRFVHMSIGSVCEVAACHDMARGENLIQANLFESLIEKADTLRVSLGALSKRLKS